MSSIPYFLLSIGCYFLLEETPRFLIMDEYVEKGIETLNKMIN